MYGRWGECIYGRGFVCMCVRMEGGVMWAFASYVVWSM